MVTEVVMLVIATAFIRISVVHTRATDEFNLDELSLDEFSFHSEIIKEFYNEDDMTPEFTEQLSSYENSEPIKKLTHITNEKLLSMKTEENATVPGLTPKVPRQAKQGDTKKRQSHNEDVDVVDREDHVTQYLTDLLVNTDSEITSLQGSELGDEEREELEVKEDLFFNFLTGRQKVIEVEGAGPAPVPTPEDSKDAGNLMNVIVYLD